MGFTLPNYPDAAFPEQSELDAVDFEILVAADAGIGVTSGCAVTAQGSPDMTVAVASGTVVIGSTVVVSSGNVTITAANPSNPRFDLIVVNSSAVKSATAGTPAVDPVFPAIPANSVVLAAVFVPASDTAIGSTQIVDKRITVPAPAAGSGWTTVSKAADQPKTSDTTLANDNTLVFTMAASTKYRIRGVVFVNAPAAPDFKYGFVGPASPTIVRFSRFHGNGVTPAFQAVELAYPGPLSLTQTTTDFMIVGFEAVVHNGANVGTFAFQWAQNTSDAAAVTVYAGSYIEYAVA